MAGKRQATSNLNHDNWDQEEEPEERGTFRTATEDELKTRVIKKGRRKVTGGPSAAAGATEDAPAETKSVFSGFSGFGTPNAVSGAKSSPFSFLANLPAPTATATATTTTSSPAAKPTFSFMPSSSSAATDKPVTNIFGTTSSSSSSISTTKESTSTTDGAKPPTTSIFGTISSASKKESSESSSSVLKATSSASSKTPSGSATVGESSQYRESVAELNRAIVKFLQEQMNKNEYCLLSPVFENYEKHLKDLKDEESARATDKQSKPSAPAADKPAAATFAFGKPSTPGGSTSPFAKKPNCTVTSGGTTTTSTTPLFSFGSAVSSASSSPPTTAVVKPTTAPATSIFSLPTKPASEAKVPEDAPKPGLFSFRATDSSPKKSEPLFAPKKDEPAVASPPKTNGFSFGLKSNTDDKPSSSSIFSGFSKPAEGSGAAASVGFSFGSGSAPFSFGNIKPPAAAAPAAAGDEEAQDEEDKPPKVEFKQVVEDDAVYSKRCKVFVKKGTEYADRGIGTLYLKPVKDSEKTQLLVRADTNLGNILVNLILSDGIPCQRMGKNNVMMVCMPTPEETKATTMLLRVKTGDEADDLLGEIKKHTK